MKFDQNSLDAMCDELIQFELASGLSINYDKTEILRLGSLQYSDAKLNTLKPMSWTNDTIKILGVNAHPNVDYASESSYDSLLLNMAQTLNSWSNRSLSLIGKVLICNTLVTSQMVYKMLALKTPTESFFVRAKKLILDFLWGKKGKPKMKYDKLIQDHQFGGLKLIDIKQKFYSLKTIWVKKILTANPETNWVKVAYSRLPIKNDLLWFVNISPKDIRRFYGSSMWIDVWHAWAGFNFSCPETIPEILDQPIFLNSFIKRNNSLVVHEGLLQLGVKYIRNLFDDNEKRFLTYQEFCGLTGGANHVDFVTYNGIIHAIPKKWKNKIRGEADPRDFDFRTPIVRLVEAAQPSSTFYRWKRNQLDTLDSVYRVWAVDLNMEPAELEQSWNRVCMAAIKTSICPKLRFFQYRLTHRKLTTNYLRSKYDASASPLCIFCNYHNETVSHMLWHCPKVQSFWKNLFKWLKYTCKIDLLKDIDAYQLLLNMYKGKHGQLINTILLITKQYIYRTKCQKGNLNLMSLITQICHYQKIEAEIAKDKNISPKHERKWALFILMQNC